MLNRSFSSRIQISSAILPPVRYLWSEKKLSISMLDGKSFPSANMIRQPRTRSSCNQQSHISCACSRMFCVFNRVLSKEQTTNSTAQVREILTMVEKLDEHEKKLFIENLSGNQKIHMNSRKQKSKEDSDTDENVSIRDLKIPLPTLMLLGCMSAIPFIGFGFLDNALMLLAGDLIDHSVSIYLHTSVMASAAMGNVVSGAIGMQVHGIIERMTQKIFLMRRSKERNDIEDPSSEKTNLDAEGSQQSVFDLSALTPAQMNSHAAFLAGHIGGTIGIIIGLCLGMTPLLFLSSKPSNE